MDDDVREYGLGVKFVAVECRCVLARPIVLGRDDPGCIRSLRSTP
jgi:hypothetical protein